MKLHATPNIITTEHKLLENIQNLLIEQNKLLESLTVKPIEAIKEIELPMQKMLSKRGNK